MPRKKSFKNWSKSIKQKKKAVYKNHHYFMRYLTNKKFTADLNQLLNQYCLEKKLTAEILLEKMLDKKGMLNPEGIFYTTTKKILGDIDMSEKFKNLNKLQLEQLLPDVEKFINKYQLGREWIDTLLVFIVSGELLVPTINFNLDYSFEPKRISIELNGATTLKDIEEYFSEIKKKQKEIWSNSKRENLTKNSFLNFEAFVSRDEEKKMLADKKFREDLTPYQEIIYNKKDIPLSEKLKIIKQNSKEQGKKTKKVISFNKKVSDKELAKIHLTLKKQGKISKTEIEREANRISKNASRQKNKMTIL